jgi:hypothetical protein
MMTKHTIEVEWEQVDALIIKDLQEAHRINSTVCRDEGGAESEVDFELLGSLEVVLAYYMRTSEYEQWIKDAYAPGT